MTHGRIMFGLVLAVTVLASGVAWGQSTKPAADKPKLDPGNAVWEFQISNLVETGAVTVSLATADGKVTRAFALGGNKAVHDVDAAGLAISEAGLKGVVKVVFNADQWAPKDGKPVECRIEVNAVAKDGNVGGAYTGKRGGEEITGMVLGTIKTPVKEIRAAAIKLELERALDGQENFQRVLMTVAVQGGKVGKIEASAKDSFHWKARVKDSNLTVTPEALTGEVTVEVYDAKSATAGIYTFALDGKVIGSKVAGKFKSKLGDKEIRESAMFSGTVQ